MTEISSFRTLRQRVGLTIEEIAKETGFSSRTVYRWEAGEVEPRAAVVRALQLMLEYPQQSANDAGFFRFVDLFAGIGGLRRGFEPVGGRCVFTSEWDRYSQLTYSANFDCNHGFAGDITKIAAEDIPEHDFSWLASLAAVFDCGRVEEKCVESTARLRVRYARDASVIRRNDP